MTGNATLNCNEPILDDYFKSQLKEVFASQHEKPGKSVLNFIFGYAAAFESMKSDLMGSLDIINN